MPNLACQNFATLSEVIAHDGCHWDQEDDQVIIENAIAAASDMIYVLSNGRVTGLCTTTKRPIRRNCAGEWYAHPMDALYGFEVIPLPDNVISVNQVKIDGAALALSEFGLIDNYLLFLRLRNFPGGNSLRLADTEVGTWSVTYTFGYVPDWLARMATVELVLALLEDDLDGRTYLKDITSANVQGASVSVDPAAASAAARGMPMLERFLGVHAPHGGLPVGFYDATLENGWELVEVEGPSGS